MANVATAHELERSTAQRNDYGSSQPQPEHAEGQLARAIEQETAKLPSDTFLWAALGSMALSLALQLADKQKTSLFVGQWAPAFLLLGLYNKIVKVAGSH
jgi:hypothetical protein